MPADERSRGLILRTRPLTESSLIVQWITPELGRIATVAKGARRAKSPFRGKLDLFYTADFSFARSRRSELHALREVALLQTHAALRQDYHRLELVSQAARLVEQTTETETPLPELFQLLHDYLSHLAGHRPTAALPLAFAARLLASSGLAPDPQQAPLPAGTRLLLRQLTEAPWELLDRLRLAPDQSDQLNRFLQTQIRDAFGIRPPDLRPSAESDT